MIGKTMPACGQNEMGQGAAGQVRRVVGTAWRWFGPAAVLMSALASSPAWSALIISGLPDTPDPVSAGGEVTYTVRVAESGGAPVSNASVAFDVPANGRYAGADALPAGVTCSGMAAGQAGPGVLTCSGLNLAANEVAELPLRVRSTVQGSLTVSATPLPSGTPQSQTTTVNNGADLRVGISGPATAPAGSAQAWSFTITNDGPDASPASTLTYNVPPNLGIPSLPSGCSLAGSQLTCAVGSLAVGASRTVVVNAVIGAGNGSTLAHTVDITAGGGVGDGVSGNNVATLNTVVSAGSSLAMGKTKSVADPVETGQAFNFLLNPSYSGDYPAGVQVSDAMPGNFCKSGPASFNSGAWSCTASSVCPAAGPTITCTRSGSGSAGYNQALGVITVPVQALTAGVGVNNTASVSAPGVVNADGTVATTVIDPRSDLRANKSKSWPQSAVPVGQAFNYTVSTTNLGPSAFPASGVLTLTDTVPAGLQVNSITPPLGFVCVSSGGAGFPQAGPVTITCTSSGVGLALNASTANVVINAQATAAGSTLTNSMCVGSAGGPPDDVPPNNCASVGIDPQLGPDQADVSALKRVLGLGDAPGNRQQAGQAVTWEVEIVNAGPSTATDVAVTDVFNNVFNASGADYSVSTVVGNATWGGCALSPSGSNVSLSGCTITSLPVCTAGSTCPRVQVSVRHFGNGSSGSDAFQVSNTAFALAQNQGDPNLLNNNANNNTPTLAYFQARTDVAVSKADNPDPVPAGQLLTYTITASNVAATSASRAFNVVVTDTLPLNVVFLSAAPSGGGNCTTAPAAGSVTTGGNRTLVCAWPQIDRGAQQTVTVRVRPLVATSVAGGGSGSITNDVVIATDTPEVAGGAPNNAATQPTAVTSPSYDLIINKVDDVDPVDVGDDVTYTLTVTNNRPSTAENLVLTDTLPAGAGAPTFVEVVAPLPSGMACNTAGVTPGMAGGNIVCTIAQLGGSGSGSTSEASSTQVRVKLRGQAKGSFNNVATVAFANPALDALDPQGNNTASEPTTFRLKADVQVVTKRAVQTGTATALTQVPYNATFDWLVDLRNNGPLAAEQVAVSDNLPAGMVLAGAPVLSVTSGTFVPSAPICTGAVGGSSVGCAIDSMPANGTATLRVPVRFSGTPADGTVVSNTASIVTTGSGDTNGGADPAAGNNFNSGSITVQTALLAGHVYVDGNGNGVFNAGERGIEGVLLTLTGTAQDGSPVSRTATTDTDGRYFFPGLPPSNATGYTITESQPATYVDGQDHTGQVNGAPTGNAGNDVITGIVYANGTGTNGDGFDFGEGGASVAGQVFNDANTNGTHEPGDLPLGGVTITLTGTDASGQAVSRSTQTGSDGRYRFNDLPAADANGYLITETQPAGYNQGGQTPGSIGGTSPVANQLRVPLTTPGTQATGYDFFEQTQTPSSLSGHIWRDLDHDRTRASGESLVGGWTVELLGCPGGAATCTLSEVSVLATTTSAADGSYRFDQLVPGDYQVRFRSTAGQTVGGVWPTDPVQNAPSGPNPTVPGAATRALIPVTVGAGVSIVNQDLPLDPSGVVYDSLTAQAVPGATVTLSGPAGFDPAQHLLAGGASVTTGADGFYQFYLLPGAPAGAYRLTVTPPAGYGVSLTYPAATGPLDMQTCTAPSGTVDPVAGDPCLVSPTPQPTAGNLPPYFMDFSFPGSAAQNVVNNHIPLDPAGGNNAIELRKTTSKLTVRKGDLVPYVITAVNTRALALSNIDVVDTLPPGFKYVQGSLTVQALPSGPVLKATPTLQGRLLTVPAQAFAPNQTLRLSMVLGVGTGVGEGDYVNVVQAQQGLGGERLSNVASATVRVVPDALFDCTDVIGKVYDDRNANGYQDEGEPGLPNVRVATVNGLLISTDAQGRYHIACAMVPKEGTGSNFVLKLDERTLPSGYRVTTDNPASERMTRGKLVKVNFGASVHRVVRLALRGAAFQPGLTALQAGFDTQLDEAMRQLAERPSILRLAYERATDEDANLAERRVAALKAEVLRRWQALGRGHEPALFNLDIEVELNTAPVAP
ncbi:SdrD B-like domain-containing protein [Aquabacterium sp. CECT 9606]|uniref:SdrD B-like domain-containing protein n=1 Tax=Aquabacterium sp. CECT 9606 TaxID=2845822 RepID=UPI001E5F1879|nr:SdrD B-like domain-containing protein [Aquabacterium sp. CECT 9606]CAH0352369.1 hypothetical protein AQB9606_02563 [Aquabacterium sp. CECT 9606]